MASELKDSEGLCSGFKRVCLVVYDLDVSGIPDYIWNLPRGTSCPECIPSSIYPFHPQDGDPHKRVFNHHRGSVIPAVLSRHSSRAGWTPNTEILPFNPLEINVT